RRAVVAAVSAAPNAAVNRRSVDTACTLESVRPRSTMLRRFLISSGLVGSRFNHPYSTHFSKLIVVSDQKYFLSFRQAIQKMIPAEKLRSEFRGGVHSRINNATNLLFNT